MSKVTAAVELIRKKGAMLSGEIETELGLVDGDAVELLLPAVKSGVLVTCRSAKPGEKWQTQYRLSAAGPGKDITITPPIKPFAPTPFGASETFSVPAPVEPKGKPFARSRPSTSAARDSGGASSPPASSPPASSPPASSPPASSPPASSPPAPTGDAMATITSRIVAAFKKHGPMTTRELSKHVNDKSVSALVSQRKNAGVLAVLGGTKGNLIYGLPDQEAPSPGADPVPRHIHARKKPAKKPHKAAAARASKAKGPKVPARPARAAEQARYRYGLFSDGGMLIETPEGSVNLPKQATRALCDWLDRTLVGAEGS